MFKTVTKILVVFLLINGCAWVWSSYILAYLGKTAIAEALSERALIEILGVFLIYATKSLFENLSTNNTWPDRPKESNRGENLN